MRGTLDEFELGDILQLYHISGRSGVVRVRQQGGAERSVYLDHGAISGIGAEGWYLIDEVRRIEWLGEDVRRQLDVMEREAGFAGLSLIARALVSPARWDNFVERQLERLIYPALTWKSGEFDAEVDAAPRVAPLRVQSSAQQLVLNAARWIEESRSANRDGYGLESRWRRTEAGDAPLTEPLDGEISVLRVLSRPRGISEICEAAGLSSWRVVDQLRRLRTRNLVESVD